MNRKPFASIHALIAEGELERALKQLLELVPPGDPHTEVLQLSGRLKDILKKERRGTVSVAEATQIHNQIRDGLLELLRELENPDAIAGKKEKGQALQTVFEQNTVKESTIDAGNNAIFGNQNTVVTYNTFEGERKIPHALTPQPFLPELFLGRETELNDIRQKLLSHNRLLLVNGQGGVGKTTLAAQYYFRHAETYAHTAWVLSEKSITSALLLLARPLGLQFDERAGPAERLELLLQALADLKKPCLLVIDNANEPADLAATYQHLRRLPNFHLLVTTRVPDFEQAETYPIAGLPYDEALELFQRYYPKFQPGEADIFTQIRAAVDDNTLVVELLAKTLATINRLKTRYTLVDLLADLQQNGLLQLSRSATVTTDYQSKGQMRRETPEAIVAAMYDLSDLSAEERMLLSNFAVLPAENISFELLEVLLVQVADDSRRYTQETFFKPFRLLYKIINFILNAILNLSNRLQIENSKNETSSNTLTINELENNLRSLAQKGWIEYKEEAFKCSPLVQEIVRRKNGGLREDCAGLVERLAEKLKYEGMHLTGSTYEEALWFARYAETVVRSIKEPTYKLGVLCDCIGEYYIVTGDLAKGLSLFELNVQNSKILCAAGPENVNFKNILAVSYSKLGDTHRSLGDLERTLTFYEQYNQLEQELYKDFPQNVDFKNNLAISYQYLGITHSSLGDLEMALTFYEQYNQLEQELYKDFPQNVEFKNLLAISYQFLGITHSLLGDLETALTFYEQYNQLEQELYKDFPQNMASKNLLAISYQYLGITHSSLGDLETALAFYEQCNQLEQELYKDFPQNVEFKNGLAISYSKLGDTYRSLGDLETALTFYEQYIQLAQELYKDFPQNVDFKNSLAISYQNLGNTHRSLGNLETALAFYERYNQLAQALYKDFPQNVEFKNNLAASYYLLSQLFEQNGELETAYAYLEQSVHFMELAYESSPNNADFRNNLKISYDNMAEIAEKTGKPERARYYAEKAKALA